MIAASVQPSRRVKQRDEKNARSSDDGESTTGLYRSDRGFGFAPCLENRVARKRDVRCVGLRHPANNGARLRQ